MMDGWTGLWDAAARTRRERTPHRFLHAIEGAAEGLWDWNLQRETVRYSSRWYELVGLPVDDTPQEVDVWLGRVHSADRPGLNAAIEHHFVGETPEFRHEFRLKHTDGGYRWMLVTGRAVRGANGRPRRFAGSMSDVTERRLYDPLTGLPNPTLLEDHIRAATGRYARDGRDQFAVLVVDLDRYKKIHLSLGHERANEGLSEVASRVSDVVSARSHGARLGDIVARVGADQFALLLHQIGGPREALDVADAIQRTLKRAVVIGSEEVFLTASVGVSVSTARHVEGAGILQEAVTALTRAKRDGPGSVATYDVGMYARAMAGLRLESDLRRAIETGQIRSVYQPIVHLADERIVGAEALARWSRPGTGPVSPEQFIPVAEEANLIHQLGHQVLRRACEALGRWRGAAGRHRGLAISVNLSARQLLEPGLVDQVAAAMTAGKIAGQELRLEITETVVMANAKVAQRTLRNLKALGVAIAIDDFCTGYSSLSYLHKLPIDSVKIDRSFVRGLPTNRESVAIVDTILTLGQKLGFTVVAEGVETPAQRDLLREMGCQHAQGFLWSPGVDDDAFAKLVTPVSTGGDTVRLIA